MRKNVGLTRRELLSAGSLALAGTLIGCGTNDHHDL